MTRRLRHVIGRFAVARLEPHTGWPWWATYATFASVTRTPVETSVVCDEHLVPVGVKAERDFAAFAVDGVLDFSEVGVLASLTVALERAGVSCFAVSTFDTDYLLVRASDIARASAAWRAGGWVLETA